MATLLTDKKIAEMCSPETGVTVVWDKRTGASSTPKPKIKEAPIAADKGSRSNAH